MMSRSNFATSLDLTLVYEGGWVDNKLDPGGATNRGVTQAVYDAFRDQAGLPRQSVRLITDGELVSLYEGRYWQRISGEELPLGLDYAVFDFAVNSGTGRAARALQNLVGIIGPAADGVIGPRTLQAVSAYTGSYGVTAVTDGLCNARMTFLRSLATFATFGHGWERRVMGAQPGHQAGDTGVIDRAFDMAMGNHITIPSNPVATVKTYNASHLGAVA